MSAPESLPACVAGHARASPVAPWLFYRWGLDWRWSSWEESSARIGRWGRRLAALDEGSRVGFSDLPRPGAVLLDLAIQSAGLVSVPVRGEGTAAERAAAAAACGCTAWVWDGGEEIALGPGVRRLDLDGEGEGDRGGPATGTARAAGGVVVAEAGAVAGELVDQASLLKAAGEIQGLLAGGAGQEVARREIVVAAGALEDPHARRLLAWATVAGAALVLEPEARFLVATAVWARPTVFVGDAGEVAALGRAVAALGKPRSFGRRAPRLPLGRLHTVIVQGPAKGSARLDPADARFWADRGARVAVV